MGEKLFLTPAGIAEYTVSTSRIKAESSWSRLMILGILAGFFIAFACVGSSMASHNLLFNYETYGLGRVLTGFIFGVGLMLVVMTGAELFTGNNLMIMGALEKKITWRGMFRNWGIVYISNLIGAVLVAVLVVKSGLLNSGVYGGMTIRTAALKINMNFHEALILGILCNMLVCGAVWMGYGARDVIGKLFACFFPIWLFVTSGFEHSIANMYTIPAGVMAAVNPEWLEAAKISGSLAENLTWSSFFLRNLLPVTIGNVIGGALIMGCSLWYCFLKNKPHHHHEAQQS